MCRTTREDEKVDEADKFISLWISFNAWLKNEYREDATDRELKDGVKKNEELQSIFNTLLDTSAVFSANINELSSFSIVNMKYPNDSNAMRKMERIDFANFIEVVYTIRCNLFHGRKDAADKTGKDYKLICLAYSCLLPLFSQYFNKHFESA